MFIIFLSVLVCLILGAGAQSCSTVGRHPVEGTNCKSYIHCTVVGSTLHQTNFTCPSTSLFNPRLQQCVSGSSYTCVDSICVQRGPNEPNYQVYYADPNDTTNKLYFTCEYRNGHYVPVYGTCNANQCFVYDELLSYKEGCCTSILTKCGPADVYDCRP